MLRVILPPLDPRDEKPSHTVSEPQIQAIKEEFSQVEESPVEIIRDNFWELFASCAKGIASYLKPGHILYLEGDETELRELSHNLSACRTLEARAVKWLNQEGSKLVVNPNPSAYDGELILDTPKFVPGMNSMIVIAAPKSKKKTRPSRIIKHRR